jgi:hypothetical protein
MGSGEIVDVPKCADLMLDIIRGFSKDRTNSNDPGDKKIHILYTDKDEWAPDEDILMLLTELQPSISKNISMNRVEGTTHAFGLTHIGSLAVCDNLREFLGNDSGQTERTSRSDHTKNDSVHLACSFCTRSVNDNQSGRDVSALSAVHSFRDQWRFENYLINQLQPSATSSALCHDCQVPAYSNSVIMGITADYEESKGSCVIESVDSIGGSNSGSSNNTNTLLADTAVSIKRRAIIMPSSLAADFGRLAEETRFCHEALHAEWVHIDVCDGNSGCPGALTIGPQGVAAIHRAAPTLLLDVHVVSDDLSSLLQPLADAGASRITIQLEQQTTG